MEYAELKPLPPAPTPAPTPAPAPAPRPADPTNQDLLAALLELEGDAAQLIRDFGLSPRRFLAFAKDPEVIEILAAFDALQDRRHRIVAQKRQSQAAESLSRAMLDTLSPVETRRAATALARLAVSMLAPPRRAPAAQAIATPAGPAQPARTPDATPTDMPAATPAHRTPTRPRHADAPREPLPDRPATPSAA